MQNNVPVSLQFVCGNAETYISSLLFWENAKNIMCMQQSIKITYKRMYLMLLLIYVTSKCVFYMHTGCNLNAVTKVEWGFSKLQLLEYPLSNPSVEIWWLVWLCRFTGTLVLTFNHFPFSLLCWGWTPLISSNYRNAHLVQLIWAFFCLHLSNI